MGTHRIPLWLCGLCLIWTSTAAAEERFLDFLQGLREREYYDTALEYLESIEQRPNLPAEIKTVIPFEKGVTLMEQAKQQRNPEAANALLDRAAAFLQQFLTANPEHEFAARANSDAANVLLLKGKATLLEAKAPANANKKASLLKDSQEFFKQAQSMFDKSYEQHLAAFKKFPVYIDEAREPKEFEQRRQTELSYMKASLDSAIVKYEAAQAFEPDTPEFKQALIEASKRFDEIYQKHRSQVVGLMAQMYQGKCFEEMGDLSKALGIYESLLSNPGRTAIMRNLISQVTHFKLICLNTDKKADYELVDKLAQEWVKENPGLLRSRSGLGIRYEQARALEALGRKRELTPEQQKRHLMDALDAARQVSRYGDYRDRGQAMVQRLNAALNRGGGDPTDFDTAYGMCRENIKTLTELRDKVKGSASPSEKEANERAVKQHLAETARIMNLALELRKPSTKQLDVNWVRHSLCYIYYLQGKSYDAALLGEFIARRYAKDEESESLPLDSAYLAMAAYNQAYNSKQNRDKETDIRRMIDICNFIATNWPDSPKAIDAYLMLGRLYRYTGQPAEAAAWFIKVPESAGPYMTAQLEAGTAYWDAYLTALNKPADQRPDAKQLADWQTQAQSILKKAIANLEGKLADNEVLPENVAFAKLTLAQMANATGQFAETIKLLETDKRSVLSVTPLLSEEKTRPKTGIRSAATLTEIYKQILRAYIGMQNLENARKAMSELEKIATGQGQDILPIYISLGKQFKEELDRLSKSNPEQYQATLKSFSTFLENMLKRKEGQTYNSLAWIGEMYIALGEGTEDKSAAGPHFESAANAFQEIVDKEASDPNFCTPQQSLISQARLVLCERKAGEFEKAAELIKKLLEENPQQLDFQVEAALVYQDWAASGQTDSNQQWQVALMGLKVDDKPLIWGWADLARKIDNQLAQGVENERFRELYLEARYNIALCVHKRALNQDQEKEKLSELAQAEARILQTVMQQGDLSNAWYDRFNQLYIENQKAMGKPNPDELPRNVDPTAVAALDTNDSPGESPAEATSGSKKVKKVVDAEKVKNAAQDSSTLMFGSVLVIAVIGGAAFFFMKPGKKKPVLKSAPVQFPGSIPVAAEKPASAPVKTKTASRPASAPKKTPPA